MRIIIYLFAPFFITSCLVWDLMPTYSSYWNEDVWRHIDTKEPLPDHIHVSCFRESLQGFEIRDISGFPEVIGVENKKQSNRKYAICLRNKGFVFNASYKYCYKFREICDRYNEYRK